MARMATGDMYLIKKYTTPNRRVLNLRVPPLVNSCHTADFFIFQPTNIRTGIIIPLYSIP